MRFFFQSEESFFFKVSVFFSSIVSSSKFFFQWPGVHRGPRGGGGSRGSTEVPVDRPGVHGAPRVGRCSAARPVRRATLPGYQMGRVPSLPWRCASELRAARGPSLPGKRGVPSSASAELLRGSGRDNGGPTWSSEAHLQSWEGGTRPIWYPRRVALRTGHYYFPLFSSGRFSNASLV